MGKPGSPACCASRSVTIEDAAADEHAAGEIAHHWYVERNWPRLEAVLTDRRMFAPILIHWPDDEILEWCIALERERGASIEERYEAAWHQWQLDESYEESRDEIRILAMGLVRLMSDLGCCGDFAERLVWTVLRIDAEDLGDDSSFVGMHFDRLARLFKVRGDLVAAVQAGLRAHAITEKADGPESWQASLRLNTLAGIYSAREEYRHAERLQRRSLAIAETIVGPHSRRLLTVLENLVNVLVLADDPAAAVPYAQRIVSIAESLAEPDPKETGRYVLGLASVQERAGDHAGAAASRRRALGIAEKELGPTHQVTLQVMAELAETLVELDQTKEAEELFRRVIERAEAEAIVIEDLVPSLFLNLGFLFSKQGRDEEAVPCFERVLRTLDEPTDEGPADPATLVLVLQQLGVAYRETGRFADAETCLLRALPLVEGIEPPRPLLLAKVLSALGQLRAVEGKIVEAEGLFERCLGIRREHLAAGDPELAEVARRLADVKQGTASSSNASALSGPGVGVGLSKEAAGGERPRSGGRHC